MNALVRWLREHRLELGATAVAFIGFAAFSAKMLLRQSGAPHFVYQADAFVHGRLALSGRPPNLNDWVLRDGQWFVSFPPFPAVLMAPFVALNGLAFNDVFFTVCVAAFNVGLFVHVMRRLRADGELERTNRDLLLLAFFWAFGSVYLVSAIRGEVWFTAHVVGAGLTLLYVLLARRARHPILAGLVFGCALLTRANLAYAFPFIVLEALAPEGKLFALKELPQRLKTAIRPIVLFGLAGGAVLAVGLWMNHERFGSATEFGHALLYNNRVNERIRQWGLFHPHYLWGNLKSAFLLLPKVSFDPPKLGFNGNGMSVFLTTPLLLLVPFAGRGRMTLSLAVTAACIALPGLFYMNNGWFQFGFRFSNDWLPYLLLILAVGTRRFDWKFVALGLAGVVVSSWGAVVFNRP